MYYDLLIHVDLADEQRMDMALTNIGFYLEGLPGETFTVALVANAGGVRHLRRADTDRARRIVGLAARGVRFKACANALRLQNIPREELLDCVEVVPAGVVELVRLQREGFAYVKP